MRILLTRPREDAERLAAKLAALGHSVVIEPLIAIAPIDAIELPLDGVQALLFTSANGVRAFARASERRDLRVMAVGEATANAALAAGFSRVESAGGDVEDLARLVRQRLSTDDGPLLHVAATDVAGDLKTELEQAEFSVRRVALYRAEPVAQLSEAAVAALRAGDIDVAVVFSPRTAQTFVRLAREAGIAEACRTVVLLAISQNASEAAAGIAWKDRVAAGRPDEPSLIAAIERLDPRRQPEPRVTQAPEPERVIFEQAEPSSLPRWALGLAAVALAVAVATLFMATQPIDLAAVNRRIDAQDRRLTEIDAQAQGDERRSGTMAQAQQQLANALGQTQQQHAASLLQAQQQIMAALAQVQQQAEQRLTALAQGQQQTEQRMAALIQAVQALERRIAALETAPRPEPVNLEPVRQEAQRLSGELGGLIERSSAQARLVALAQLRDALARGAPFAVELATARRVLDPAGIEALAPLAAHAERGIATRDALTGRFAAVAEAIQRGQRGGGGTLWERALDNLSSLVRVRPVGEAPGPAPEAVVARAERRLLAGDLAGAVGELGQLTGAPAETAAAWRGEAQARLAAERIMATLLPTAVTGAAR